MPDTRQKERTVLSLKVYNDAFAENGVIPAKYTCDGINVNPTLHIDDIPDNAKSLAIIMDDPDAPGGVFTHWVNWNIHPTHILPEHVETGVTGMNDFSRHQYSGPCPPSGTHRYYFHIYALDCMLELPVSSAKIELENAMHGHILAKGSLMGKYARNKKR